MIKQTESLLAEIVSERKTLANTRVLDSELRRALRDTGYKIVKAVVYSFKPLGATLVYVLTESHVIVHTYPEWAKVSLDMNLCHGDIEALYQRLLRVFAAQDQEYYRFARMTAASSAVMTAAGRLFQYRAADGVTLSYDAETVVFDGGTKYQHISIIRNTSCGLALFLDGLLQFCDADKNFYGRLMTRPIIARTPKHVLILGGGEGQVAQYLLRNSDVRRITIVEVDSEAVDIYRQHIPEVGKLLASRRVRLLIGDAFNYVARQAKARRTVDGVVLDLTHWPLGMSYEQYYDEFLGNVGAISSVITFFSVGPLEKGRLISEARPLGQQPLKQRFAELGFRTYFKRVVHPVWGSICTFGHAEKQGA